jgi:lipopolysaccharide/colanic/teichoic acid biosynthesis glycosyltransferase
MKMPGNSRHPAMDGGYGGGTAAVTEIPLELALDTRHATLFKAISIAHVSTSYERYVKPAIDRVAAILLIVLIAPVLVAVSFAVFAQLGAPVLLRQRRIKKNGEVFEMYKFRTMRPDRRVTSPGAGSGARDRRIAHKRADDPRLVPLGRFLRKWSLDELPQLFNVVRGDMSLVGPRPELESVVRRHYQPWQNARHQVKPGMTGWWQVTERGSGQMHEHTEVDLHYISNVRFATDLKILLWTIPAAMGKCRGQ